MHSSASSSSSAELEKKRHRHTPAQLAELNQLYNKTTHPPLEARTSIGERIGMETKTVNAWFQNKRASTKKRSRESIYQLPHISSLSTASSYTDLDDEYSRSRRPSSLTQSSSVASTYIGNTYTAQIFEDSDHQVRRMRMRPSAEQTEELRKLFNSTSNPTKDQREELGRRLGMRYESVTNWFQNQRSVAKKRKEEEDARMAAAAAPTHMQYPASRSASPNSIYGDDSPRRSSLRHSSRSSTPYGRLNTLLSQRPRRSRPEPYQLEALKTLFNRAPNPTIEERTALAMEIGMDIGKVTNWFRNLRQTARKRATKKVQGSAAASDEENDEDDTSTRHTYSPSASRSGTPSLRSCSSSSRHELDETATGAHSDVASEDEYQEAVTPPQCHSPSPPPRKDYVEEAQNGPRLGHRMNIDMIIDHPSDPRMTHLPDRRHASYGQVAPPVLTLPSIGTLLPLHKFSPRDADTRLPVYTPPPIRDHKPHYTPPSNSKAFPNVNIDDALLLLGIQSAFKH